MIEKQFRIFTNDEKTNYYLITNIDRPSITEIGKLISCTSTQELSNAAINIPVKTYSLMVKFFSATDDNYDTKILSLPINYEVWEFTQKSYLGVTDYYPIKCWYVNNIKKVGKSTYTIDLVDEVTLGNNTQTYGRNFTGEYITEAINTLTNYDYTINIHPDVSNLTVFGYYAPNTISNNLQELALNYSLYMEYYSEDDYTKRLYIGNKEYPTHDYDTPYNYLEHDYSASNVFAIPELAVNDNPTSLSVTSHNFQIDPSQEVEELFNSRIVPHAIEIQGNTYYGEIIYFDKPYSNITIENGTQVVFNREGYLIFNSNDFSQNTVIQGVPYRDDTNILITGDLQPNTKVIDKIYSIHPNNLQLISENLLNYYEAAPNTSCELHHDIDELVIGEDIIIPDEYGNKNRSRIISITTNITNTEQVTSSLELINSFETLPPEPEKVLDHIEITQAPTKTQYYYEDTVDTTGMEVTAYWDDGTSSIVTDYVVSPTQLIEEGIQTITVYYSKNTIVATDTFNVRVRYAINDFYIDTPPDKVIYYEGEHMNYTGLATHISYVGTSEITRLSINDLTLQDFVFPQETSTSEKVFSLPIIYQDPYSDRVFTKYITVYQNSIGEITNATLLTQPTITEYYTGDTFVSTGMTARIDFSSGVQRIVDNFTYSTSPLTKADEEFTVSYLFRDSYYSWDIPITVHNVSYEYPLASPIYAGLPIPTSINVYLDGTLDHLVTPSTVTINKDSFGTQISWTYNFNDIYNSINHNSSINVLVTNGEKSFTTSGYESSSYDNFYVFYNTYSDFITVTKDSNNNNIIRQNGITVNGQSLNTEIDNFINITTIDEMPTGQYMVFFALPPVHEYIPVFLIGSQTIENGQYTTAESLSLYTRYILPKETTTELSISELYNLQNNVYSELELDAIGCEYAPFVAHNYIKDTHFIDVDSIVIEAYPNVDTTMNSIELGLYLDNDGYLSNYIEDYVVEYQSALYFPWYFNLNNNLVQKWVGNHFHYTLITKPDSEGTVRRISVPIIVEDSKQMGYASTPSGRYSPTSNDKLITIKTTYNSTNSRINFNYEETQLTHDKDEPRYAWGADTCVIKISPDLSEYLIDRIPSYADCLKLISSTTETPSSVANSYITKVIDVNSIQEVKIKMSGGIQGQQLKKTADGSNDDMLTLIIKRLSGVQRYYSYASSYFSYFGYRPVYQLYRYGAPNYYYFYYDNIFANRPASSESYEYHASPVDHTGYGRLNSYTQLLTKPSNVVTTQLKNAGGSTGYYYEPKDAGYVLNLMNQKINSSTLKTSISRTGSFYLGDASYYKNNERYYYSLNSSAALSYSVYTKNEYYVRNIELIVPETVKTEYEIGEEIDGTGLQAKLTYADGHTQIVTPSFTSTHSFIEGHLEEDGAYYEFSIFPPNMYRLGTAQATVYLYKYYRNNTTGMLGSYYFLKYPMTYDVTITGGSARELILDLNDVQTQYQHVDSPITTKGLKVYLYENGTIRELSDSEYTVTHPESIEDSDEELIAHVTVTYEELERKYLVEDAALVSWTSAEIYLTNPRTTYDRYQTINDDIDFPLYTKLVYYDSPANVSRVYDYDRTEFSTDNIGTYTLTFEWGSNFPHATVAPITHTVTVVNPVYVELTTNANDNPSDDVPVTLFYKGQTFNHDNLVVKATSENGGEYEITNYTISTPDTSTTGTKTVTVTYNDLSTTYDIEVVDNVLTGVDLDTYDFYIGDSIYPDFSSIKTYYNNSSTPSEQLGSDYTFDIVTLESSNTNNKRLQIFGYPIRGNRNSNMKRLLLSKDYTLISTPSFNVFNGTKYYIGTHYIPISNPTVTGSVTYKDNIALTKTINIPSGYFEYVLPDMQTTGTKTVSINWLEDNIQFSVVLPTTQITVTDVLGVLNPILPWFNESGHALNYMEATNSLRVTDLCTGVEIVSDYYINGSDTPINTENNYTYNFELKVNQAYFTDGQGTVYTLLNPIAAKINTKALIPNVLGNLITTNFNSTLPINVSTPNLTNLGVVYTGVSNFEEPIENIEVSFICGNANYLLKKIENFTYDTKGNYTMRLYPWQPDSGYIYDGTNQWVEKYWELNYSIDNILHLDTSDVKMIYDEPLTTNIVLNKTGLIVYYWDGTDHDVTNSATVTLSDINLYGTTPVNVTYNGYSTSYNITVNYITDLTLDTTNVKKEYYVGDTFSSSGGLARAIKEDGTYYALNFNFLTITAPDMSTAGTKRVTATLTTRYSSHSNYYDIVVRENNLTGISIATPPTKTTYIQGDTLDTTGLTVNATYESGSTASITGYTVSSPDMETIGTKSVIVTYNGFTASFDITVNSNPLYKGIKSITLDTSWDTQLVYQWNSNGVPTLNDFVGHITYYDDTTESSVPMSQIGARQITSITYAGTFQQYYLYTDYQGNSKSTNKINIYGTNPPVSGQLTVNIQGIYAVGDEFDRVIKYVYFPYNSGNYYFKQYEIYQYPDMQSPVSAGTYRTTSVTVKTIYGSGTNNDGFVYGFGDIKIYNPARFEIINVPDYLLIGDTVSYITSNEYFGVAKEYYDGSNYMNINNDFKTKYPDRFSNISMDTTQEGDSTLTMDYTFNGTTHHLSKAISVATPVSISSCDNYTSYHVGDSISKDEFYVNVSCTYNGTTQTVYSYKLFDIIVPDMSTKGTKTVKVYLTNHPEIYYNYNITVS